MRKIYIFQTHNSIIFDGTKRIFFCFQSSFQIPQSLGVIGGKPNLALYFIGCVGTFN